MTIMFDPRLQWTRGLIVDAMQHEARALVQTSDRMTLAVASAAHRMAETRGRVVVVGVGKSGTIGHKFASSLQSICLPSQFIHASDALHGDIGAVTDKDTVFVISASGETEECCQCMAIVRQRTAAEIIVLTCNRTSTLARQGSIVIDCGPIEESDPHNILPTASATVMLSVCNGLTVAVSNLRGFTRQQFSEVHPAGGLGIRLSRESVEPSPA